MLEDLVQWVIGVDTHKSTHTGAVVTAATGAANEVLQVPASTAGYEALVEMADAYGGVEERAWSIEGTGSYGAGLAAFLEARGELVIELDRPARPARRDGAKDDGLDAIRAAREALSRDKWAAPRARGEREAMRVVLTTRASAVRDRTRAINQLKGMIVSAPEELRDKLRGHNGAELLSRCLRLRVVADRPSDHQSTVTCLRRLASRIRSLDAEIRDHDRDLRALTQKHCPQVASQPGIGHVVAAQAYVSWSHPGRCRSEAAFAGLAGVAPIPASSGEVVRVRLNRGGDRQHNRALHTVVLTRARMDALDTRRYLERRVSEGKTLREARRCLKRYVARSLYRSLEAGPPAPVDET